MIVYTSSGRIGEEEREKRMTVNNIKILHICEVEDITICTETC
jgi:hypothetical protein